MSKRKSAAPVKGRAHSTPNFSQVHVSGRAGVVFLTVGDKTVTVNPDQADRIGTELIRKADVSRMLYRVATGMTR